MPKNVSIQKILGILLRRIYLIILSGILVALIFFTYTSFAIKPSFSTSAMIYIQNYGKQDDTDDLEATANLDSSSGSIDAAQKIYSSDISGSTILADICVTLFQNSDDITNLYNGCGVSMSVAENTFYITIGVTGRNPQKCAEVANNIANECGNVYKKHFPYGRVGTIREARVPGAPTSPNKTQNTIIGFLIGVVIACAIAILLELIDTTIKGDDDLVTMYKIPVFAEIPDFENMGR